MCQGSDFAANVKFHLPFPTTGEAVMPNMRGILSDCGS